MKVHEWIKKMVDAGFTCDAYTGKLNSSVSKKDIIDVCLDANGITFLCDMQAKGFPLPYENILREYGAYINGRYKAEFDGYSSSMYCCYFEGDNVVVDTTQALFLGCNVTIKIKRNAYVKLYVDRNCDIKVECGDNAKCIIVYWTGAKITLTDSAQGKCKLIEEK